VGSFNDVGSLITADGRSENEILRVIGVTKTTFEKTGVIYQNRSYH